MQSPVNVYRLLYPHKKFEVNKRFAQSYISKMYAITAVIDKKYKVQISLAYLDVIKQKSLTGYTQATKYHKLGYTQFSLVTFYSEP